MTEQLQAERRALEAEVNVLIKRTMDAIEEMAILTPEQATDPVRLNERRTELIRMMWATVKRAIRFGGAVERLERAP